MPPRLATSFDNLLDFLLHAEDKIVVTVDILNHAQVYLFAD